jgi:hypothetical protein
METIKIWARPAILAGLWLAAASFTLAELTTVLPSLRAGPVDAPRVRDAKPQSFVRARTQPGSRASVAP